GSSQVSLKLCAPSLHIGVVGESFRIVRTRHGSSGRSIATTLGWGLLSLSRGGSMMTKLRVETPGTRRRKGLLRAVTVMVGVYVSVYIWCAVVVPRIPVLRDSTVVLVAVGIVGVGTT